MWFSNAFGNSLLTTSRTIPSICSFFPFHGSGSAPSANPQISLAIYKTMDVENNPELLSVIKGATIYGIERKDPLNKTIKKLDLIS